MSVALVLGFLVCLTLISASSQFAPIPENKRAVKEEVSLTINLSGEIKRPGTYACVPGTTIKQLIGKRNLTKNADRKKVQNQKVLYQSQSVKVPFRGEE